MSYDNPLKNQFPGSLLMNEKSDKRTKQGFRRGTSQCCRYIELPGFFETFKAIEAKKKKSENLDSDEFMNIGLACVYLYIFYKGENAA